MDPTTVDIIQSIFRWTHVVAGILWIGLLYFFNWVNSAFAPTMDGETKKKVVPELMPRALFWFRWGAAWTWITGILLLALVFYHGGIVFKEPTMSWGIPAFVMVGVTLFGVFLYDWIVGPLALKKMAVGTIVGFVLICAVIAAFDYWAGFGYRAYVIHTGGLFGTIMAFNVWFRIWPSQKKIITAVKNGEAPDAKLVALAGLRSKHNTYLSVPLVWTMLDQHTTWSARTPLYLMGAILLGWWITSMLFRKAPKVKGF